MCNAENRELFDEIVPFLCVCDLIIVRENEKLVGLSYDHRKNRAPQIYCKYEGDFTYFLTKIMKDYGLPCFMDRPAAEFLFWCDCLTEVPSVLLRNIASYYYKLGKEPEAYEKDSFEYQIDCGVKLQDYQIEKGLYKKAVNKALRKERGQTTINSDVVEYLKQELCKLTDYYPYKYMIITDSSFYSAEFTIEKKDCNDISDSNYVFISKDRSRIFVGNKYFLTEIDSFSADMAVKVLETVMQLEVEKLPEIKKKYYEEFKISENLWDIAYEGITTLLKINSDEKNLKYSYEDSSRIVMLIYLEKLVPNEENNKRMYKICITYKEFLRNPDAFREFLQNPKVFEKWNFWCKEVKYSEKKLKLT